MSRLHVMLRVKDLDTATRFYSTLFDAPPTKTEADYAKWMLDDPRVNFSVAETDADHGIEHLGIQAETPDELAELRDRIERVGGTVTDEGETTCCYAHSDKTWVEDPQGVSWEAFYTHGEAATYGGQTDPSCC
jgi:catechol 2,3-dioxygenase-like lactoylglutathione lyase family enzyme